MDKTIAALLLALLASCSALDMKILSPAEIQTRVGNSEQLVCNLGRGVDALFKFDVRWLHIPFGTDEADAHVLSKAQSLVADSSKYSLTHSYDTADTNLTLKIFSVEPSMEGQYKCVAKETDNTMNIKVGGEAVEKSVNIIVVNDVTGLQMNFDMEAVRDESSTPLQRVEGDYSIECKASGFSPSASVSITLDGEEIQTGGTDITLDQEATADAGSRRYTAKASVNKIHLSGAHDGKTLKCEAAATFSGANNMAVSAPLAIVVLEPQIQCETNASARSGDRYVEISCMVDHGDVTVKNYTWQIGEDGKIITRDSTDVYDMVLVQPVDSKTDKVTLQLYQVDEKHFDTYYFLRVTTDKGRTFREMAALVDLGTTGSSSRPTVFIMLFVLTFLLTL